MLKDRITTTFTLDAPFLVDIVENLSDNTFEAWLYDDNCAFKMLMFGAGNPDKKSASDFFEEYADAFSGYQDIYNEDLKALEEAAEKRFYR